MLDEQEPQQPETTWAPANSPILDQIASQTQLVPQNERHYSPALNTALDSNLSVIEQLKKTELITQVDLANLKKAEAFMLSTYTDVPSYRPTVVKLSSVLSDAKFPTADRKYWQCKAEAEVHFNELTQSLFKMERSKVDLEEMDYKISSLQMLLKSSVVEQSNNSLTGKDLNIVGFDLKRLIIARQQYEFNIKLLEKDIKYRIKEITDWSSIAGELEHHCKYSTKNYGEHTIESHKKYLEYEVKNIANTADKRADFKDQLDTLNNIIR